ncbi:hypothetical protein [Planctomicrobium sp. SH664]|uniref:hypothetical protein n=1 Tax=Planctomicrobium sp. SH664 TaxID=3448125 RepID=UPI003F5C8F6A
MNKAFIREPESDGRAYCPRCQALGIPVSAGPLDTHVRATSRQRLGAAGWFCSYARCEVAYFDLFNVVVTVDELREPVYPKDPDATLCACFGFSMAEIEADNEEGTPSRIRALLARSQSPEARCATLAADGRCCLREVQRLYMKLRSEGQ